MRRDGLGLSVPEIDKGCLKCYLLPLDQENRTCGVWSSVPRILAQLKGEF
jgi:hypothetical protein